MRVLHAVACLIVLFVAQTVGSAQERFVVVMSNDGATTLKDLTELAASNAEFPETTPDLDVAMARLSGTLAERLDVRVLPAMAVEGRVVGFTRSGFPVMELSDESTIAIENSRVLTAVAADEPDHGGISPELKSRLQDELRDDLLPLEVNIHFDASNPPSLDELKERGWIGRRSPIKGVDFMVIEVVDNEDLHFGQMTRSLFDLRSILTVSPPVGASIPDGEVFEDGRVPILRGGRGTHLNNIPDDYSDHLWGLGAIDATKAWTTVSSAPSSVIAIIDSGIDASHPGLAANLWVNEGEIGLDSEGNNKSTNGRDDDENGIVDDVHGGSILNLNHSRDTFDRNGHGTHVSGIAAAVGNNADGMVGVLWRGAIMPVKALDGEDSARGNAKDIAVAIHYAINAGCNVINCSFSLSGHSPEVQRAMTRAIEHGIFVVVAAGNDSREVSSSSPLYPLCYDGVIGVAALDDMGNSGDWELSDFSNYGRDFVDIAAPGRAIWSTYTRRKGAYKSGSGTSMAAPFVSGTLALASAHKTFGGMASNDLKRVILNRSRRIVSLESRVADGRMLNLGFLAEEELSGEVAGIRGSSFAFGDLVIRDGDSVRLVEGRFTTDGRSIVRLVLNSYLGVSPHDTKLSRIHIAYVIRVTDPSGTETLFRRRATVMRGAYDELDFKRDVVFAQEGEYQIEVEVVDSTEGAVRIFDGQLGIIVYRID